MTARRRNAGGTEARRRKDRDRPEETPPAPGGRGKKERLRRWFRIGLLLFFLGLVLASSSILIANLDRMEYGKYMGEAARNYQVGEYDEALSWLRRAERLEESGECRMLMADCYEAQGNLEKALEILRSMDPEDEAVAKKLESVLRQTAQRQAAETVTLGGRSYPLDARVLVLDAMDLTDESLADIRQLSKLDTLSLADNRLRDLSPLAELGGLVMLDLRGNEIEDLSPLSGLGGLRSLYLDGNPLNDLSPLYGLSGLSFLSLTELSLDPQQLEELTDALPGCVIRSDAAGENVFDISIAGVTFKSNVRRLDLSGLGIQDVTALAGCGRLETLDLSGNELSDLSGLMNLPVLEELDISGNLVRDLRPLMGMDTLRILNASGNQIADTASLGEMDALVQLDLSGNPLGELSGLAQMESLSVLSLRNAGLEDEDLSVLAEMTGLSRLNIRENPALSGEAVDKLKKKLRLCAITHSELVYTVDFAGIPVRQDTAELDLSGMGLKKFDTITELRSLESLDLSDNKISNIYIFQYTGSRDTIQNLDLSFNDIEDITALSYLTALERLDLSHNRIDSVRPLLRLKTLRYLNIEGNPLTEEQLEQLREALPDCEIIE